MLGCEVTPPVWAQAFAPIPGADNPYALVVDVRSSDGTPLLHKSFRCKSFLLTCEGDVSFTVEGKPIKASIHGRAYDGRHLEMQIEGPLGEAAFERVGFHDRAAKPGEEWEGELIQQHVHDFDPKWTAAQREAARRQPPTLLAKVRVRIDD
jgi:hypothetical protein